MKISVGIPTKHRYDVLDKCLLSIALQTLSPYEVIIVDDSDKPVDLRQISYYEYIFKLFDSKGIKWKVAFGLKKGQHYSHQFVQENAEGDLIFRIDDDEVAEPDVLEKLHEVITKSDKIGAVAPAVLMPNAAPLPVGLRNTIGDLTTPNMQWFSGKGIYDADHLYSCFLYRKNIAKFDLNLSTVCHREETIFTHSIKRAGYGLIVYMDAVVYHFRAPSGGIRTFNDTKLWESDEKIFRNYLNLWQANVDEKIIVLDNGLGDHYAFKNILPDLRKKHKKITIAACYPDVFFDESDLKLISIAEAKLMFGNIDSYSVYRFMIENNWIGTLVEAFNTLYNADNNIALFPETKE